MYFTITKEQVIDSLQKAASILPSRTGATYLRSLWFKAHDNRITIMSTDANIEFTASYPAEVREEGILGISGRQIVDLLCRLSSGKISISLDSAAQVAHIEQGRKKYKLPVYDASWFNELTAFPEEKAVTWSGDFMEEMIERVLFCIEENETSEAVACLYMGKKGNGHIDMCGLNGHQFALSKYIHEALSDILPDEGILLQKKYVQEIKKWLGPDDIEISITEKRFFVRTTDKRETFSVPRSHFLYPEYSVFLDRLESDNKSTLTINCKLFAEALERISLFDSMSTQFSLSPTELMLSAQGADTGSANEYIEIEYTGSLTRMLFPTRKFIDVLKHFTSETITLTLTDAEGPCGVHGEKDIDYMVIIMPMKITEDTYYSE